MRDGWRDVRGTSWREAIAGLALALPFVTLLSLLLLRIEPPLASALRAAPDAPNYAGTLVVLGALALALIGLVVNARELVTARAGWLNLAISGAIVSYLVLFVGAIVVDQLPCWQGLPNCD